MRLIATLLALEGLLAGCNAASDDAGRADKYSAAGQEIVQLLRSGEYEALAARLHYPATYTGQQLEKDRADVAQALAFVASEFGTFGKVEPVSGIIKYYNLEIRGGDLSYWRTQPKTGRDGFVRYRIEYDRLGPGFLKVTFYDRTEHLEIRAIDFELDASQPGARETIIQVGKRLVTAMGMPNEEKVQAAIDKGVPRLP